MNQHKINTNTIIIGGGISGLFTLNYLNNQGVNAILLEENMLGSKQTICSQGIIHGGLKYALQGVLSRDSESISNMPYTWKKCLEGNGMVDLSSSKILSDNQYLFSTNNLSSKISNFFASKFLRSRINTVSNKSDMEIFDNDNFNGNIYKLNEIVLDIRSVISNLADNYKNKIIKIDSNTISIIKNSNSVVCEIKAYIQGYEYSFTASNYVFTAGEKNKHIFGNSMQTDMQLRPLHMVYLIGKKLPKLFGHCVDGGMVPKATITTHYTSDGTPVWYFGGKIAESGINKSSDEQITSALHELKSIFPWLEFSDIKMGSFFINRAEAKQSNGAKPESATVFKDNNSIIAWPTKLALAPILAENIFKLIDKNSSDNDSKINEYSELPKPEVANYPWES